MRTPARPALGGLLAVFAVGLLPPLALAQDSAFFARFDFGQTFEYDDNPDFAVNGEGGFIARTDLDFRLERATGIARFVFDIGGELELGDDDLTGDGLQNPTLGLSYDRDVGHARFGASLRYRETDVSALVTETDPLLDAEFATLQTGSREDLSYGVNAAIGIDAPLGASLDVSRRSITYSGTSGSDLRNQDSDRVTGAILFRIDPRVTGQLIARYSNLDVADDGVDRRTIGYATALNFDVTPRLSAAVELSYDRIELSGGEDRVEEGTGISVDLTREMMNGTMGLLLASSVGENGRRDQIRFRRGMELPRGALSFSVGLNQTNGLGIDPLYGIDWRRDLPRGQVSLSLSQTVTTDVNADEQINSTLTLGITQDINSLSSLSAQAAIRATDELGSDGLDSQRIDLSVTYRRELERDWDLVGGFAHVRSTRDGEPDRSSNRIFIGLDKSLVWN